MKWVGVIKRLPKDDFVRAFQRWVEHGEKCVCIYGGLMDWCKFCWTCVSTFGQGEVLLDWCMYCSTNVSSVGLVEVLLDWCTVSFVGLV